ncbi:MAG TPA: hypothetical protein VNR63_07735 [Gaiellaceae bacterium]|jgi:hypothetical protein|nr:hypothetical protein [Gaiellaceae bacterium]
MIAAAWLWVLAGVAFVLLAGLVFVVLLGMIGMPGDFLRRLVQTAAPGRSEHGQELPGEVPTASAEETAGDDDRHS